LCESNPETLATLGTTDTGRRQTKQKTKNETNKQITHNGPHQKHGQSGVREGKALHASYKNFAMLLI